MDSFEDEFTAAFETASLEGALVTLRGLRELDCHALFAKVQESRVFLEDHLPWIRNTSPADLKKRMRSWILSEQLGQGGCWQIYANGGIAGDSLELNGLAGFIMAEVNLQNHSATVSYWLFSSASGRGFMTEALDLLQKFCFNSLKLNRLEIFASIENEKSQRVAERCGFLREGVCRDYEFKNGAFVDHVRYSRLAKDL